MLRLPGEMFPTMQALGSQHKEDPATWLQFKGLRLLLRLSADHGIIQVVPFLQLAKCKSCEVIESSTQISEASQEARPCATGRAVCKPESEAGGARPQWWPCLLVSGGVLVLFVFPEGSNVANLFSCTY